MSSFVNIGKTGWVKHKGNENTLKISEFMMKFIKKKYNSQPLKEIISKHQSDNLMYVMYGLIENIKIEKKIYINMKKLKHFCEILTIKQNKYWITYHHINLIHMMKIYICAA